MKRTITTFSFLLSFIIVSAQQNGQQFVTADIDNFWTAYDKIVATKDSAEQYAYINKLYIEKGTPGLALIMQARRYTPQSYITAINSYPLFWASIRPNTYKAKSFAQEIERSIAKLKTLYPLMRPAKVYFTIGAFRTGGTTIDSSVLIGSEIAMADENTVTKEFPANLSNLATHFATNPIKGIAFLNVHEYVHTQQKNHDYILLYRSIYEGIAEFVAVTATGEASTSPAISYGKNNNARVREKFTKEIFSPHLDNWFYNDTNNEFKTRDLGYYVGYAMAESYYNKAKNKQQAISEMIDLDYTNETAVANYVDGSGYFSTPLKKLRKQFEKSRPRVTGIKEFKNGAKNVDPSLTTVTVQFSEPLDKRHRGFELGPLGENNVLRVQRFIGFSEDGKSVSFEIGLKPGQRYQLELSNRFRTTEGVPLKPCLIDISTAGK